MKCDQGHLDCSLATHALVTRSRERIQSSAQNIQQMRTLIEDSDKAVMRSRKLLASSDWTKYPGNDELHYWFFGEAKA